MEEIGTYSTVDEQQFNELLSSKNHKPFLVAFTADWLGEGTIMDAIIEGIASDFQDRVGFYRVDVEQSKNLSHQLGIRRLPAIFLFKNGELSDHFTGMVPSRTLEERMSALLD